jgi:hypothetical protein
MSHVTAQIWKLYASVSNKIKYFSQSECNHRLDVHHPIVYCEDAGIIYKMLTNGMCTMVSLKRIESSHRIMLCVLQLVSYFVDNVSTITLHNKALLDF